VLITAGAELVPQNVLGAMELPFTHGDSNRWFWYDADTASNFPAAVNGGPQQMATQGGFRHQIDGRGKRKLSEQDEVDITFQISPLEGALPATTLWYVDYFLRFLFVDS